MAQLNTSAIDAAFDAINEESVDETTEDSVEIEDSEPAEEESADDSLEPEESFEDSEEEEEEDEISAEANEEPVEEEPEWDGNPATLSPKLLKSYKTMQAAWTKKTTELAQLRKEHEEGIRQVNEFLSSQKKAKAQVDDPRPENPTTEWDDERAAKQFDKIAQWNARQERRAAMENGEIPDPEQYKQLVETQKVQLANERRISWLQTQPEYQKLENHLLATVEASEFWQKQLRTDDGVQELYNHAKTQVDAAELKAKAAELENAKIKRAAGTSKRSTSKPNPKKAAVEKFSDAFEGLTPQQKIDAIIDESFG